MSKLTMEALEQHHDTVGNKTRRVSVIHRDGSDSTGLNVTGPNLRRLSRPEHRLSVQYGAPGRRYSQISRTSVSGSVAGPKHIGLPIKVQNTYRLEPLPKEKFDASKVQTIMYNVLESYLDGEKYDPKMCSNLAQNLTDVIKNRVKELGFVRYKLICNVIIGQNSAQGMRVASRCLWDANTDSFATAQYAKGQIYAVASVFATYFE